ncbi:MAG: flagellar basal body-associated FliL family protein [Spirochaetaceae bacterium]|jgi:flagellar FliL protein|nr:flagellar basal body-associated FliL family protein [Spirochaetaceae bacterium]
MSDDVDLGIDDEGSDRAESGSKKKKISGLGALLPNLLKFAAIGLGALVFIVTVSIITYNLMSRGGKSQTALAEPASPYVGKRPEYQMFTSIGSVRTRTKDATPYSVVVNMVIGYDMNDKNAQTELTSRLYELRDFVRVFFSGKYAAELQPENEARLKQEILEAINTRYLDTSRARIILFEQLDRMEM